MGDQLARTVARILGLHWDTEKKAKAIAMLSEDDVQKLCLCQDAETFEATLEALLPQGILVCER